MILLIFAAADIACFGIHYFDFVGEIKSVNRKMLGLTTWNYFDVIRSPLIQQGIFSGAYFNYINDICFVIYSNSQFTPITA